MKKKITAAALVLALLAITVIGGTMAYFTDTKEVTNTFTMGNVAIKLEEPAWDRLLGQNDKLKVAPGQSYDKDPTITVTGSEDCWLVATVTISNLDDLDELYENDTTGVKQPWGLSLAGKGKMVSGGIADWSAAGATENGISGTKLTNNGEAVFLTYAEDDIAKTITYTFYFMNEQSQGDKQVLFEKVNIPAIIDNGDINGDLTVTVNAYAIQKTGFADVFKAYAAYKAQEG